MRLRYRRLQGSSVNLQVLPIIPSIQTGVGVRVERTGDGDGGGAAVSELYHVFEKERGHSGGFQCTGAGGGGWSGSSALLEILTVVAGLRI